MNKGHEYETKYYVDKYNDGGDHWIQITHDGNIVYEWNDNANIDYPEDLSWSRDLSKIFEAGVKLGKLLAKDKL